jgi:hypothetical protein
VAPAGGRRPPRRLLLLRVVAQEREVPIGREVPHSSLDRGGGVVVGRRRPELEAATDGTPGREMGWGEVREAATEGEGRTAWPTGKTGGGDEGVKKMSC